MNKEDGETRKVTTKQYTVRFEGEMSTSSDVDVNVIKKEIESRGICNVKVISVSEGGERIDLGLLIAMTDKKIADEKAKFEKMIADEKINANKILSETQSRIIELQNSFQSKIKEAREDAVARSRSTLKGKIGEQLAPLLDIFPFEPADARFIGSPIDFVIFNGLSKDSVQGIVLAEIKTGKASLSKSERAVKKCIEDGAFKFQAINIDEGLEVTTEVRDKLEGKFVEND